MSDPSDHPRAPRWFANFGGHSRGLPSPKMFDDMMLGPNGLNELQWATALRQGWLVDALLLAGNDPNAASPHGVVALDFALGLGDIEITKKLLSAGAVRLPPTPDPRAVGPLQQFYEDTLGWTPLHYVSRRRRPR